MDFTTYLITNNYSNSTIKVHTLRIKRFKQWIKNYGLQPKHLQYNDLLQYINYLRKERNYTESSTNNEIRAVKIYYDYLIEIGITGENPAENTHIKGKHAQVIVDILSEEELEDLYYSYEIEHHDTYFKASRLRDKIVLGLLVFQGIKPIEIYHLQDEYLDLRKGQIDIPSTRRTNKRTLNLKPLQIIEFLTYTKNTKDYLSKRIKTHNDEQLIFGSIDQIRTIASRIIRNLKKYNHKVKNLGQIRSSIIINWLSQNNLRKTQYLAGHRYISSTERYQQDDLENLHEIVNNFHPISE